MVNMMSDYNYNRDTTPTSISWSRISGPGYQLITVAEARHHMRLESYGNEDDMAEDNYITDLIAAAGDAIETHTRRPIRDQQRELIIRRESIDDHYSGWNFDGWSWNADGDIILNATPIRSIDSISYMEDGQTRVIAPADYVVVGVGEGIERNVRIYPPDNQSWPWTQWLTDNDDEVRVTVTCGYTQDNLPATMKHACRLMVNDWYNMRGGSIMGATPMPVPRSVNYLLSQHTREVFH